MEILIGLDPRALGPESRMQNGSPYLRTLFKSLIRTFVIVLVVIISIVFPAFDSIMALMGSALCFTICIVLPCSFYLKIFWKEVRLWEKIVNGALIVTCGALAVVGTVWAVLPKSKIGAE